MIDPQSWNRYSYVRNNAINRVDPLGFDDEDPIVLRGWAYYDREYGHSFNGSRGDDIGMELPSDPSWGGGGGGDGGVSDGDSSGETPAKTWQVDVDVLTACVQDYFGIELRSFTPASQGQNGSFTGFGPDFGNGGNNAVITVTNDATTYSVAQITQIVNAYNARHGRPPIERATGFTGRGDGYNPYTNYSANNLNSPLKLLKTQIHELGESLGMITQIDRNPGAPEQGFVLEECMDKRNGWKYQ